MKSTGADSLRRILHTVDMHILDDSDIHVSVYGKGARRLLGRAGARPVRREG